MSLADSPTDAPTTARTEALADPVAPPVDPTEWRRRVTDAVIRQLARPAGAPDGDVEVCETHSALVVFAGDRAYKVKKPLDLGFLDFSTLGARRRACTDELELNRRLAADVYLRTAALYDDAGAIADHVLVMRRLPADRRLSAVLAEGPSALPHGPSVDDALRDIARQVAVLHARPTTGPGHAEVGSAAALRARWTAGFAQMRPYVGAMVDAERQARIEWLALRYLDGRGPLFDQRLAQGHVRDGHGDLLADDIFVLDDGPRIIDCLDFDAELRWGDVLADVGFLAMDLEHLGHPGAADRFLAAYREFAGETWCASLADHHIADRAHVRAKVAVLRAAQTGRHDPGIEELQQLALDHLERARVRLVLVGGLPGTGKSTLAEALSARVGAVVVRTDELRAEMVADGRLDPRDHYGPTAVGAVYREALGRAERLLGLGEQVIVDATWAANGHRDAALALARSTSSDLVELECRAPADVCAERIGRRAAAGTDPSEATVEVAATLAASFAPWPEATVVDTAMSLDTAVAAAARAASWA